VVVTDTIDGDMESDLDDANEGKTEGEDAVSGAAIDRREGPSQSPKRAAATPTMTPVPAPSPRRSNPRRASAALPRRRGMPIHRYAEPATPTSHRGSGSDTPADKGDTAAPVGQAASPAKVAPLPLDIPSDAPPCPRCGQAADDRPARLCLECSEH